MPNADHLGDKVYYQHLAIPMVKLIDSNSFHLCYVNLDVKLQLSYWFRKDLR